MIGRTVRISKLAHETIVSTMPGSLLPSSATHHEDGTVVFALDAATLTTVRKFSLRGETLSETVERIAEIYRGIA